VVLREALERCREQFASYAESHRQKAAEAYRDAETAQGSDTRKILHGADREYSAKAATNQAFVDLIDTALAASAREVKA